MNDILGLRLGNFSIRDLRRSDDDYVLYSALLCSVLFSVSFSYLFSNLFFHRFYPARAMVYQVYKENLVETILPSIQSVMTAVLHYKKMGGEANLYINDDGLQVQLIIQFTGTDVFALSPH